MRSSRLMSHPLTLRRNTFTQTFDATINGYRTTQGTPTDLPVKGNLQFIRTQQNSIPAEMAGFKDRPVVAYVFLPNTEEVRAFLRARAVIVDNDPNSMTYLSQFDPVKPAQGKAGAVSIKLECVLKREGIA